MKLSKLSKQTQAELELLGTSPDDVERAFRAHGITSLDSYVAHCIHAMVRQADSAELVAYPPVFMMQNRSEQFLAYRWA
jgi:hypothetical protein